MDAKVTALPSDVCGPELVAHENRRSGAMFQLLLESPVGGHMTDATELNGRL